MRHEPSRGADGHELRCAALCCAVLCCVLCFSELSPRWHLLVQANSWRPHFRLRLTAPRQMSLQGRILKAAIVHFVLHVSWNRSATHPGAGCWSQSLDQKAQVTFQSEEVRAIPNDIRLSLMAALSFRCCCPTRWWSIA